MKKLKVRSIILLVAGILALLAATPAYAVEAHFYAATHGLSASFYARGAVRHLRISQAPDRGRSCSRITQLKLGR
jgi:hypothetical protein